MSRVDDELSLFTQRVARDVGDATAFFNLAIEQRRKGHFADAIQNYRRALRIGISRPEEAYSNLGNIYSELNDVAEAEAHYKLAIDRNSQHVPAILNLAILKEELGQHEQATELYQRILEIDPFNCRALVQVAFMGQADNPNELLALLDRSIEDRTTDAETTGLLYFAKGKLLDDLQRFDEAALAYGQANETARSTAAVPRRSDIEAAFTSLQHCFSRKWIEANQLDNDFAPVFICGMYRSGSTLLENVLSAHRSLHSGGELATLPRLIQRFVTPYPRAISTLDKSVLRNMAGQYREEVVGMSKVGRVILDKRPDNFLHIGLIKTLFPKARIIHTTRGLVDNCLSIFFQPFDRSVTYSTDLASIAHYRTCHDRLMAHWIKLFPDDIHSVSYESLVRNPSATIKPIVDALGIAADDPPTRRNVTTGRIRTASLWQVRQRIHEGSVGRWKNYPRLAAEVEAALLAQNESDNR